MLTLAYGEFTSSSYWGMVLETTPFLLLWILPPAFLYVVSSSIARSVRVHLIGVLLYLVVFFLLAPQMGVKGAWGPAHVAMAVGFWAWPAFFLLLIGRVCLMYRRPPVVNADQSPDSQSDSIQSPH